MRPFHLCSTVFPFFSAATLVAADVSEIIGNQDSRISYSEGWERIPSNIGAGGTLSSTSKASGKASLTVYNATRIDVHVLVQTPGQAVQIFLDNQQHVVPVYGQPAWSNNSLDPSIPHTLQVVKQNPAGQYTSLDFIMVTHHDPLSIRADTVVPTQTEPVTSVVLPDTETETTSKPATSGSLSPNSSSGDPTGAYNETNTLSSRSTESTRQPDPSKLLPTPLSTSPAQGSSTSPARGSSTSPAQGSSTSPAQGSDTEPVSSGGKLAVIIAICIAICIAIPTLIIACSFRYRQKKRKAASTADIESIAARGHEPPQSLQSGPSEAVETQPDRVREDGGPHEGRTGPTPEGQTDTDRDTPNLLLEEAATPQLPPGSPTDHSAPPPYSP